MIDQRPPELFAERPVRSDFVQARPQRVGRRHVVVILALAVLVAGITLYLKFSNPSDEQPTEIPTIKAEAPIKQRPEQPGGIDIPHQDVLVFQQIENGSDGKSRVEHLLPAPETPQATESTTATAPVQTTLSPEPVAAPVESVPAPTSQTAPPKPRKPVVATTVEPESSPEKPAPVSHETAKFVVTKTLPKALFTTGKTGLGSMIQLASIQDRIAAQNELKKMQAKYKAALGDTRLRLAEADLGSKGTYFRVQSEPLTDTKARGICAALKKQQANCIIVLP